ESDTNHVPAVIPGFTSFGSGENCEMPTTIVEFRNIDFDSSDNCSEESDSGDNRNSVNPRYPFGTYLAESHLKEKTREKTSWDDVSEFSNENVETAVCHLWTVIS
ncbi:hypothetical protein D917_10774, partial [Trichinella nativa]